MTYTLGTLLAFYGGMATGSDLYRAPESPQKDVLGLPLVWLGRSTDAPQAALSAFLDLVPIVRQHASR